MVVDMAAKKEARDARLQAKREAIKAQQSEAAAMEPSENTETPAEEVEKKEDK